MSVLKKYQLPFTAASESEIDPFHAPSEKSHEPQNNVFFKYAQFFAFSIKSW